MVLLVEPAKIFFIDTQSMLKKTQNKNLKNKLKNTYKLLLLPIYVPNTRLKGSTFVT